MLVVRNMIETDVAHVARLEQETFQDAWTEQGIYDTFCQKQAFVVVAQQEEKILGYCIVYFVLDEAEIARVAVDKTCRRQGVGRKILNCAERICKDKQIARLLLDVRESNGTARRFYEDYGFVEDGIRKDFYDMPKENAVLMSKNISFGNPNRD